VTEEPQHFLDITAELCPMTFVRTRLMIDKMSSGEIAEVLLTGTEPVANVPASITELGHAVLSMEPRETVEPGPPSDAAAAVVMRLRFRKA
jgi:TusA-related sulfurtransferase